MNIIGKNVKLLREAAGLSRSELVAKLEEKGYSGYSIEKIGRIENNTGNAYDKDMKAFSDVFGVTYMDLMK